MKLQITGASNFVNRMFEACGGYQWAREFLKNAMEAEAKRIEFGIEWQAVDGKGVYRRTIVDDGAGMGPEELVKFFSTLGEGAKKIGGVHDNFGVGAKIAALPWNPDGVVIISYKKGEGALIWIRLDEDSGDYELAEFEDEDGEMTCVIDPDQLELETDDDDGVNWGQVAPEWARKHGTVIVLLGSQQHPDTVLGNPAAGEHLIKGLSVYLNSRFWDLTDRDVTVTELRSEKKSLWPSGPEERDDSRRPNNRKIRGARYYLEEVAGKEEGKLGASDALEIDDERVRCEWYLWAGERPKIHPYARRNGYIAVRYNGELFELTSQKVHFRWFGIVESAVQQNLTIVLEPQLYRASNGRWGVHPDQSRNRLIFTGGGEKGGPLPLAEWGLEFAENLPSEVLDAIRAARGEQAGTIDDEEYRKRLQDKFGSRWRMKRLVETAKKAKGGVGDDEIESKDRDNADEPVKRNKRKKVIRVHRGKPTRTGRGDREPTEKEVAVDVPRFRMAKKEDFEKPWHLALWVPNDPEGPTVLINVDSLILQEIVEYHQAQYPDVYAEEVAKTIRHVFGEVAACKVAHSQKLARDVPREELDRDYRNEQALTIALMGLLAEETVIAQRLGKLGRKKSVA